MTRSRLIALLIFVASILLAALIVSDVWPGLRGPAPGTSEWHWFYQPRPWARWLPAGGVAAATVAFAVWWWPQPGRARWPVVVLVLLSLGLQLAILYADRPNIGGELVDRTLSKATNGYVATAGEIDDLNAALRDYPALMTVFDNEHARTHPPGLIVAHWTTDRLLAGMPALTAALAAPVRFWRCTDLWIMARPLSTSAGLLLWSWVPVLAAALTVWPGYAIGRRWYGEQGGRLAALLTAAIPALLIFSPSPDQLFALLSLVSLWLLLVGLEERRPVATLGAGLVVSLMSFLSLGNAVWFALLGAYVGVTLIWPQSGATAFWRQRGWWQAPALLAAGAAALWLIYWAGWGVAPWSVAQVGLDQHSTLVTSLRRYEWWLVYNPLDFALFVGLPVLVGFGWQVVSAVRRADERATPYGRLALLLAMLLIGLTLAGTTRGEVGRLWLLFMPLAAVLAGGRLAAAFESRGTVSLVVAAQLLLALSLGLAWRPFFAVILPVERPGNLTPINPPATPAETVFLAPDGTAIELTGFDSVVSAVDEPTNLELTLHWQANGPTLVPYTVFTQLIDATGSIAGQQDNWPAEGQWPTTCWRPGEQIADTYRLPLPPEFDPAASRLVIGLYDGLTGERLPANTGGDSVALPALEGLVDD